MCNTPGTTLPSQPGQSAFSQQSSVPITSTVEGRLQGDTRVAGKTPPDIWTCNDTQAQHLKRMCAASKRVSAARSAMTGTREEKHLMLNDFNKHPERYNHTPQHRELKAALEDEATVGADDWAHTREHGHEPFVNTVCVSTSYVSNVTYITSRAHATTKKPTMMMVP
jgi:hypothetical protein